MAKKVVKLTGPTPYTGSSKGASMGAHAASAGRGGPGKFGKGDGFKTRSGDLQEPQSHAAFEKLGT